MLTIEKNPLREGLRAERTPEPNTLIILGATGDLTKRKLIPALFSLFQQSLLPPDFRIFAFARREKNDDIFREEMRQALATFVGEDPNSDSVRRFLQFIHYHKGDFTTLPANQELAAVLAQNEKKRGVAPNRLFYLATPPSRYEAIINNLGAAGLANTEKGWTRIIIEKPFGDDLASARKLNQLVNQVFRENQIYRIDHYLGKETVQNILYFRFSNGIFEPVWNRRYVDHVQITVAETIGVEERAAFFEETGITRDIVQNHIFQLLTLFAMEPPAEFEADAVRDEKVKVLRSIIPIKENEVEKFLVRGQYAKGSLLGEKLPGYLQEEGVSPTSTTETYMAGKFFIDNWRWAGVPVYIRAGKRLPKRVSEIAIQFKNVPLQMFSQQKRSQIGPNVLALRIQPDEGISLRFDSKVPGPVSALRPVTMDFNYGTSFGHIVPDAYERLLLDAMIGDATLFTRADENEKAWEILQPVFAHWQANKKVTLPQYEIGSWGPQEADAFLQTDGREWRRL